MIGQPAPVFHSAAALAKNKIAAALAGMMLVTTAPATVHAETIGLVLTTWHIAGTYSDDAKTECAHGINPDARANFRAQFKTEEEQAEAMKKFASVEFGLRGPNGESMNYSPHIVHDLLPWSDAQGKISNGLNLDGTTDGQATAKTCAHTKFTSPEGEPGIDNQMYRVFGCIRGMRPGGMFDTFYNAEIALKTTNRWVVEITGVDDSANDDRVEVTIAAGLDKLLQDASGKFVPGLTQRMTPLPDYIAHTTGRIVDHVLITDPFEVVRLPTEQITDVAEWEFRNLRLKLKLTDTGAAGALAAYQDNDKFYRMYAKTLGAHHVSVGASSPSVFESLKRNADGFKDPKTGQCTATSSAYDVEFVRAFIVREAEASSKVSLDSGSSKSLQVGRN